MAKLGTSFHRTFALNRPGMSQVLRVVGELASSDVQSESLSFRTLEENTTLGPVYIAAMRRYAYGTRLVDDAEKLTVFGRYVLDHDAELNRSETLWCLHFGLVVRYGPGPVYWHRLVVDSLRPGDVLDRREIAQIIHNCVNAEGEESISRKTAQPAATTFLGTYSKSDALGPLGVLTEESPGTYTVQEPSPPPLWAFGYALADYWSTNWGDVTGVNLTRVAEEGGVGPIFIMGGGLINRYLGELQREGLAVVQRRTPPFQLTRNWDSPEVFLERMYG